MTTKQKQELKRKVNEIYRAIEDERTKIVRVDSTHGDISLNKEIGGVLTTAYVGKLLSFIEIIK